MADTLTLKWGTLKGWDLESEKSLGILRRYVATGVSAGAMSQRDTEEQKSLICELVDAVDGEIFNDWSGELMSKDEAKKYVMEYGQPEKPAMAEQAIDAEAILQQPYHWCIIPESDGTFTGVIQEFPGCIATGYTMPNALANLRDVAEAWLASTLERGLPVPEPEVADQHNEQTGLGPKTVDIEMPLVVTCEGEWCAYGTNGSDHDWGSMEDTLCQWDEKTRVVSMPDAYHRIIVTATIPVPEKVAAVVQGVAVPAEEE